MGSRGSILRTDLLPRGQGSTDLVLSTLIPVCLRIARISDRYAVLNGMAVPAEETMVIRCSHCKGLMRIDEGVLPTGRSVKVRCPHCNEVGPIQDPVSLTPPADSAPDPSTQSPDQTIADLRAARPGGDKPPFPSGVASDFRFPAEQVSAGSGKRAFSRALRMLLWAVGSLLVVGFFALLVNIILPGPYGGGSDKELPPHNDASTRPVEKTRPSQWEKDAGRSPAKR